MRTTVDLEREECKRHGEHGPGDGSESFGGPGVAIGELVDAIESPGTVEKEDKISECLGQSPPVTLAPAFERLWKGCHQCKCFENDLGEEDHDGDKGDDAREDEKDGHESIGLRDCELLNVCLDTRHVMYGLAACGGVGVGAIAGRIVASVAKSCRSSIHAGGHISCPEKSVIDSTLEDAASTAVTARCSNDRDVLKIWIVVIGQISTSS